jgi:phosphosulfolactate phosphohydrolase-like enzyme
VVNNDKLASQAVTTNKILGSSTGSQFLMTAPEGTNVIWRTMSFVTVFETNNIVIPTITTTNYHGMSSVPDIIRVALVNATTELGYAVGDEISAEYLINVTAENPVLSVAVDSTYWYLAPGAADWQVRPKGSTTFSQLDKAKWYIKARLIWFSQ